MVGAKCLGNKRHCASGKLFSFTIRNSVISISSKADARNDIFKVVSVSLNSTLGMSSTKRMFSMICRNFARPKSDKNRKFSNAENC